MNSILLAGTILVAGSLGGAIAAWCKCPRITGYLIVGMLFSPSLFHLIPKETLDDMRVFTTFALGIIAYEIGASLRMDFLRSSRRSLFWITTFQALFPCLLSIILIVVISPLLVDIPKGGFWTVYLPLGLLLGAMACPTAPAITVALVHECKAKGPVTTLLFAVVALTDALAIIAYSVASGISRHLVNDAGGLSLHLTILHPLLEIIKSAGIGLLLAGILLTFTRFIKTQALLLVTITGVSLLCTGLSELLNASGLLANMALGFVVINGIKGHDPLKAFEDIEDIVFTGFFVISGMFFDLDAMKAAGLMTFVIIFGRCSGKYLGARVGAVIAGADEVVRKYLGLALLPKAGLVIGLAIAAKASFSTLGPMLFNAMLASVIINTLFTPPLAKYALKKIGECRTAEGPLPESSAGKSQK